MRNAGEHQRALLFDFLKAARHAVETSVDFANFAHARQLVEHLRVIAGAYAGRGQAQIAQRLVDKAGDDRRTNERQQGGDDPPACPGLTQRGIDPGAVEQQPVGVAFEHEADPQARAVVHDVSKIEMFVQPRVHRDFKPPGEFGMIHRRPLIARTARVDVDAFFFRQIFEQRNPVLRVGVNQRQPREIDQAGDLSRGLLDLGAEFEQAKALEPSRQAGADQQDDEQKSAPVQAAEQRADPARHTGKWTERESRRAADRDRATPRRLVGRGRDFVRISLRRCRGRRHSPRPIRSGCSADALRRFR